MTRKIKKGYDWVEEQQEKWEGIAFDKIEQLDKLSQTHIDWFNKHSTISDILAWKRPLLDPNNKELPKGEKVALDLQHQSIQMPTIEEDSAHLIVANSRQGSNDGNDKLLIGNDNVLEPSETLVLNSNSNLNQLKDASDQIDTQQNDNLTDELIISSDVNKFKSSFFTKDKTVDSSSLDSTKTDIPTTTRTIMTEQDNCTTKSVELPVLKATTNLKTSIKRISSVSKTSEEEVRTPELVTDSDCTQTQTQKDPQTPESYVQVEMKVIGDDFRLDTVESEHSTKETFGNTEAKPPLLDYDDEYENEENDEIQLVVSNRNFQDEYKTSEHNILKSPVKAATVRSIMSPPRNAAQSNPNKISPIRHQSPFMSRLFQFGSNVTNDNSQKGISFITTRPKSTVSTSTINSEASNNLSMSLLKTPDNKRPLEPVASEIEVSDTIPHSRFKRPKSLVKKQANVDPTENIQESKTDKTKAADTNKEEDKQADPEYLCPSWAKNPELSLNLKNQSGLDPDKIFGPITPLCLEEIFSHSHKYLTEIPEQPPQ